MQLCRRLALQRQQQQGQAASAYVSGDQIAGDSCARTTWENATVTASWLRQHHPGAPVLLITDPWQLPRAAHAFRRQGLQVHPLALRESAATLLYRLQGRM